MQLYNTLSERVETFESGPHVSLYVCGITPYDTTHLGHAFLYVVFDVLIRRLEATGYKVTYAQNVTDIDDDILRKAWELDMDYLELGRRETARFQSDLAALNVRPPDHYPKATEEIEHMVELIGRLVNSGHAYVRQGNVYFRKSSYPSFGELSKLDEGQMLEIARERGGDPDDPRRDDPLDFLLWKAAGSGNPSWPSPWSEGRPGWHIECSQMALRYLGQPVSIHGGGSDLIFPHHECERAQSESLNREQPFVCCWVHVGMLRYQGEKMSKSLGNLVLVSRLLEQGYSADAIRIALLSNHYRESWEYGDEDIGAAQEQADAIVRAVSAAPGSGSVLELDAAVQRFGEALDNDLDTPGALAVLLDLAADIEQQSRQGMNVATAQSALRKMGGVLGLTYMPRSN